MHNMFKMYAPISFPNANLHAITSTHNIGILFKL